MNYRLARFVLICAFGLSACMQNPTMPNQESINSLDPGMNEITENPILHTPIGEFEVVSSRLVEQAHGYKAGPEEKILLIVLTDADVGTLDSDNFSLDEFETMMHDMNEGEIYVLGSDGSRTSPTMGGWIGTFEGEFGIGFVVPKSAESFQLFWWQNDPILLDPVE